VVVTGGDVKQRVTETPVIAPVQETRCGAPVAVVTGALAAGTRSKRSRAVQRPISARVV
jgi:hypothetical protein